MRLVEQSDNGEKKWNSLVMGCPNFNVYASFEWGEYKSVSWKVTRLAFYRDDQLVGAAQLLTRRILGITIGWLPGGIQLPSFEALPEIMVALQSSFRHGPYAIRINFLDEATAEKELLLGQLQELRPARHRIRGGFTVLFDLNRDDISVQRMSSNHRHYIKKASNNNLEFTEESVSSREFVELHKAMTSLKGLSDLTVSLDDVRRVAECFGEKMTMYSVRLEQQLIACCLVMKIGHYAYFYLAASNAKGRELFSSFYLIVELLKHLKRSGVKYFDFGGLAPHRRSTAGVTRFKTGFSGKIIRHLGEYDLSSSRAILLAFNHAIAKKFA